MASEGPTAASDFAAKLLTAVDSISGYTILALAAASAVILTLPTPMSGLILARFAPELSGRR
jgi:hypothetical protein